MTIYGFLAIALICVTAICITHMIVKTPKNIQITKIDLPQHTETTLTNTPAEHIVEQKPQEASMDGVIQALNELMGVDTLEVNKEDRHDR